MRTMSGYSMVGGTTPPQSDSGEISRVLVLNLLWQSKRCSRTAQDISVLTTPSLLSRGTPGQKADSSPLKRIRNDKYLKAGSRRGAPRNDKYVSERGGETLGVSLRFPFGKNREALSAPLAAGMHRSFVGSPSRGEGLRCLRMTMGKGRVLGR